MTASKDADARLWDVATGRLDQILRWHFGAIGDAAISPDGQWIATAGPVTIQIWRVKVGTPLLQAPLFTLGIAGSGGMTGITFDASSRRVLAVTGSGQVLAFRCQICGGLDDLLRLANQRLALTGRTLTKAERKQYGG